MIRAVLVDFGETLVERVVDDVLPLSELPLTPFADAVPALAAIKHDGYRLAVVSNTSQSDARVMDTALRTLGMRAYVDVIVTSTDVGREKPDPLMFRTALDRLGCGPAEAVMVGDDIVKDVGGARGIGIVTIHLRRPGKEVPLAAAVPDFHVASLLDVPALLARMRGRVSP